MGMKRDTYAGQVLSASKSRQAEQIELFRFHQTQDAREVLAKGARLLKSDKSAERIEGAEVLGEFRSVDGFTPHLLDALAVEKEDKVKIAILTAMISIEEWNESAKFRLAASTLERIIRKDSPEVACLAVRAIGKIGGNENKLMNLLGSIHVGNKAEKGLNQKVDDEIGRVILAIATHEYYI